MVRITEQKATRRLFRLGKYLYLSVVMVVGIISILATNGPDDQEVPPHWAIAHSEPIGSPGYSGIWGTSPNDIWVFGPRDRMLHWDEATWSNVSVSTGASNQIYDMWGSSENDIWAVGDISTGEVLHWNGSSWTKVSTPNPYPGSDYLKYPLLGVSGSSANDVWIVGEFRKILHWNGSSWSVVGLENAQQSLFGVWVLSDSDAWAVGENGTILHWNGSSWLSVPSGTNVRLYGVWGTATNNVWAVGMSGVVLHWDGSAWSSVLSGTNERFENVWGSGPNDIWAVGTDVIHWDGTTWSRVTVPGVRMWDVWTAEPGKAWGVYDRNVLRYE